jgi:hypothetical protein
MVTADAPELVSESVRLELLSFDTLPKDNLAADAARVDATLTLDPREAIPPQPLRIAAPTVIERTPAT